MKSMFHKSACLGISLPLLTLGLLTLTGGCNRPAGNPASGAAPQSSPATPTVSIVKPERKTITQQIPATGEIQAFQQTPLYAKIAGYVEELPADMDIGKRVRKGEVLARLSVPELVEVFSVAA